MMALQLKSTRKINLPPSLQRRWTGKAALCISLLISGQALEAADVAGVSPPSPDQVQEAITTAKAEKQSFKRQLGQPSEKLDPSLLELLHIRSKGEPLVIDSPLLKTKNGNLVQIYLTTSNTSEATLNEIRDIGADIDIVIDSLNKVQAWAPIEQLTSLAQLPTVRAISKPHYATTNAGRETTQGDAILRANKLRELGITGKGIRVGIISDGANDWPSARNSGDLPQTLTVYGSCSKRSANPAQCSPALTCNEGTAMAEIIHDLAPDAELAVAAVGTSLEFISQINRLAGTFKANIIVDDLGFFGEPYFADGDLARAVTALPSDILYVSSAGNSAASHYERDYRKFPASTNIHDFGAQEGTGPDETLGFVVPANRGTVALLQWNESFNNPSSDYDLYIFDSNGTITQQSAFDGGPAIEGVCVPNTGSGNQVRFAVVDKFSGSARRLEMFFLGAGGIEYEIPSGSIFGHPGVTRALAIGTINAGSNSSAFYSSRGPAQNGRPKPDLTGVDGVSVTGAGGFPSTFFGTSAAAPHVAGVAALLMSASKKNTTQAVRQAMLSTATDFGSGGRDSVYGFGRVNAEAAITQLDIDSNNLPLGSLLLLLLDGS